jgi:hypothetical protein
MRVDRQDRCRRQQELAAVSIAGLDRLRADAATRAGLVVDDDGRCEGAAQLVGEQARHRVGRATGREADDDAHGLVGEGRLRLRNRRDGGSGGSAGGDQVTAVEHGCCLRWML